MAKSKEEKLININYTAFQFIYWMMNSAIYSFAAVFLLYSKFNNRQIGWVLATANFISIFLQPFLSQQIIGKLHRSIKSVVIVLTLLTILTMIPVIIFRHNHVVIFILYTLATLINLTLQPLVNSLGFAYSEKGISINFGISRGTGSLSYAITSYTLGYLLASFTPNALPVVMIVLALLFLLPLSLLPTVNEAENSLENKESKESYSLKSIYKKYPFVLTIFLGISFLFIFHTIISTSITQILKQYGGDSKNVGLALLIAGLCELPAMFGFTWLMKFKPASYWLNVSIIFFVVRSVIVLFATNIIVIECSQFLQAVSFALFIPASSYMMNQILDKKDNVLGQTVITAGMTCGGIISNIIGGYLLDLFGVFALMSFATVCALIGAILVFVSVRMTSKLDGAKTFLH
ncbi:MFS transporter [Limosilactobacillus mucosae]|uniref:MFS transporter n=1 Tax=Limosilactobacillus mucosae TaxID=97478 RepID=A0AAJ1HQS2_LIMMU|nr:MFS transporter [Limosilactobacillus mucosae]MDC2826935.1 MFS transporter [Limosilactobacillus mucosae]MDC2834634.1 MFS transporter [Limosilactobacillus mucosae]